ncbi:redoxin domain-containing protein [Marinicella rhabdoformis]|uniref:redoxin domain-containing protein n=1 Tax=Marinicella rhabdoformis TaxID=2580566 RepID=UPI0012AECB06|nr:redoxin domain-containing protein [Marinicella rhabdoformis]
MTLKIGSSIENIKLPEISGELFTIDSIKGKKALVAFHRFATCPFCNLRIHQLVKNYKAFGGDLAIVAIFDSPLEHLQTHAKEHKAPFAILADENNTYYQAFSVERSVLKTIKGFITRLPTALHAMLLKGYWPFPIKGNLFTMPLEILIDENGIIKRIHKGKDEGDHLSIEVLQAFAKQS